jgi:DNA replication licensing factor MCM4
LWGTSININEVSPRFRSFLIEFRSKDDENYMENYYMRQLSEIRNTSIFILNIDGTHLYNYDKQLYYQIINFPTEMIPVMDVTANALYQELFINSSESKPNNYIQIRIINLIGKSRMRDLGPNDIDKLICISGLVIRNSEIIPEMRDAFFKCSVCNKTETSLLQRSKIIEPNECKNCNTKSSFQIIHNRSTFSDKQHVKLQETPEHMPEGETPITINLCCYDELVDFVKPGDRCEIVGIFRATSQRINPRLRITRSIYRTYIDVVSFAKFNKKRLNNEEEEQDEEIIGNEINQEFKKKLENDVRILSKNPNVYDTLVDSFAPSIWENDDVKKGLLLQLFGGVNKDLSKSGRGKFRGDINVLLVGDPSTAKSQFLQYVHNLAPRGIYTSGKVRNYNFIQIRAHQ